MWHVTPDKEAEVEVEDPVEVLDAEVVREIEVARVLGAVVPVVMPRVIMKQMLV